ncbi:hypothetical protein A1D31_37570 [Bradyrhizobium liaoningense]|nr:hypothetical protein A1D31_37570 [Bradyrhizobium liaoningense]
MDPRDFDPFNVPAWSQVQHDGSQEPQTSQAGQDRFEQHLAEARQAEPAPGGAGGSYPHLSAEDRDLIARAIAHYTAQKNSLSGTVKIYPYLSPEDRNLIDRVIAQYTAKKNPQPNTVKDNTAALRRLANHLRGRGQKTNLTDYAAAALRDHVNTYFPNDRKIKTALGVLLAYRGTDPGYPDLSTGDRDLIDNAIAQYVAKKNPRSGTVKAYTRALVRLGKDLRDRGQTIELADHKSLLNHVNTHFPNDASVKAGVRVLLAYHGLDPDYPNLSPEDRNLIDSAIAQYVAKKNPQPTTVKFYTLALRRLGNDFRARGQTTDLTDHKSLLDHVNTYFPDDAHVYAGVEVFLASINYDDTAQWRVAKKPRTLNDLEETVIYRQPSANVASDASSAAPQVASTGVIIRGQSDRRPFYSEDAAAVLGLEQALIEGGMDSRVARGHGDRLLGFSRWLFENNRPNIVARLDGKSLSGDEATHKYTGGRNTKLFRALELLRTFRATGLDAPILPPSHTGAQLDSSPQNAALIDPESAVLMEPRRIDDAAEASTPPEELQGERDGQHAPRAFIQAQAAFDSEQLPQGELQRLEKQLHDERHGQDNRPALSFSIDTFDPGLFSPEELRRLFDAEPAEELLVWPDDQPAPSAFIQEQTTLHPEQLHREELRRVRNHLEDEAMPLPGSVAPEEFQRPDKQLRDEFHGLGDNHPALSFSVEPDEFTLDRELFSLEELLRSLDDEPADELQQWRDDHPAPSAFMQAQAAFHSEQLPQGELRRVLDHLDDEAMPPPASVASEELQRLEKQLHDELHGLGDNDPALSFSIDPEGFTFDRQLFSPEELRRLLDDEPAEELQDREMAATSEKCVP